MSDPRLFDARARRLAPRALHVADPVSPWIPHPTRARIALRADIRMWIETAIAKVKMTITALGLGPASSIPE